MKTTKLLKAVFLAVFTVQLAVGRRIPASSPTMWGLIDEYGKYYKGKVVAQEDDMSGVYFYANIKKKEYFIMNDEFFDQRLAMDVDPRPEAVHVGSVVLFEFTNYNIGARYLCYIWETRYKYKVSTGKGYYIFLVGNWRQGQESKAKDWERKHLKPQWVGPKDMHKMRLVNTPREYLCAFLDINCKSNEKCFLLDKFLPLVGCKHKTFKLKPGTIPPYIPTTRPQTTRAPPQLSTTHPPTQPPIIHPPTIPTKYTSPTKTPTESGKKTQDENPSGSQYTEEYIPDVEEIYEDDKKWLATLLPLVFVGGVVVVVACLVTCVIRYIRQRQTSQQNDADTEAQTSEKKKVKKRRKHKDNDTKESSDRKKKRKKRTREKSDEATLETRLEQSQQEK